ncbi:hypothetical protein BDC45DRAFT_567205 [Circinella umbellata]|nr:hypothetical protein BDC45DRAFT_567205 [Circinella umbellata]
MPKKLPLISALNCLLKLGANDEEDIRQFYEHDGDLVQQKIDFILRNSNDESDYLSAEEKPGDKNENNDLCKGRQVQRHMLDLWNQWLG